MFGFFKKKKLQPPPGVSMPYVVGMNNQGEPVWGISLLDEHGNATHTDTFPSREIANECFNEMMKPLKK